MMSRNGGLIVRLATATVVVMQFAASASASFDIVRGGAATPIVHDARDAEVVAIAAKALATDVERITDVKPAVNARTPDGARRAILVGTLGKSGVIDRLAGSGKLDVKRIKGQWESFVIAPVEQPTAGLDRALVIAGSDPRGTAFGVFELSERLGVSPWVWWADVRPERRRELSVQIDRVVVGPPSVKYRGIFLNDEDWGLQPWAARHIDTDIEDIGPNTYAHIFELLLRLRGNFIWTAMHPCTNAFFYYDGNPEMAKRYDIVIGSSHCEPMLRNNVIEWRRNAAGERVDLGPWRYDTNAERVRAYWEQRVREAKGLDAVYTIGMRGIHDSGMPGGGDTAGKIKLLEEVMRDQRRMLREHINPDVEAVPQIFCPYKEVLHLYQAGLDVPEDVTIVWADDNHGYIRKLSTPAEQRRGGRSGVYYHLSYWGAPADYLWISSTSPALVSYEMTKAHEYGADRLWVFNVGDIKPAEKELEFAMDLAWDVDAWPPGGAMAWLGDWVARTFGQAHADPIVSIMTEYYRLAAAGKPEHVDRVRYSQAEAEARLEAYADIAERARQLESRMPERLRDAYFQLVLYPVVGAAKMNEKHLYARENQRLAAMGQPEAVEFAAKSRAAHEAIEQLTERYNKQIAGGKWDGMMDMAPRGRGVFRMPGLVSDPQAVRARANPVKLETSEFEVDRPMTRQAGDILVGTKPGHLEPGEGGRARLTFDSHLEGNQPLYFLARTPSGNEDSWYVTVNELTRTVNNQVTGESWRWLKVGDYPLRQGRNTIHIAQREPNARVRAIQFGSHGQLASPPDAGRTIPADKLTWHHDDLALIAGLGPAGAALSRADFAGAGFDPDQAHDAPSASVELELHKGARRIEVHCVPTHAIHEDRHLRAVVQVDDGEPHILDLNHPSHRGSWSANVLRGYSVGSIELDVDAAKSVTLRVGLLDPGLAVSRIRVH